MGDIQTAIEPVVCATGTAPLRSAIEQALETDGYWAGINALDPDPEAALLALARSFGSLYVPEGCDPSSPVLWTRPTLDPQAAPFDRREPIGWHGDFASHEDRPEISLVYVSRADPAGGQAGAWRLAAAIRVMERLGSTAEGRAAIEFLTNEKLPFSYAEGKPVRWFRAIETDHASGAVGLRFYEPSIVRGCVGVYGDVPNAVERSLRLVKVAADETAEIRPTPAGSLLVINNWSALHDRVEQSVTSSGGDREALLAFVARRS
jgi:hypothetical protein